VIGAAVWEYTLAETAGTDGVASAIGHPPPEVREASIAELRVLRERFGESVLATDDGPGEPTALVSRHALVEIARFLRDERGFQLLRSVTAVDLMPHTPRLRVVYHLTALPARVLESAATTPPDVGVAVPRTIRLKVPLEIHDAVVDSLTEIYPTANFHERETFDMFGVEFTGHPDLRRILLPDDFEGHPLRKDHPLRYEVVAFTHNERDVMRRKPSARS